MMLAEMKGLDCQALQRLSAEMLDELKLDILPFWMINAVDNEKGGYYGRISNDLMIDANAPKGGILNSRIL
jgi:mannobiose 2-epimerase